MTILASFIGNLHFGKSKAVNLNRARAREERQDLFDRGDHRIGADERGKRVGAVIR